MSRPPAKEQPADMQDDMTALHTTPYHMSYLPMPSLAHNIPRPSDIVVPASIEKVGPCHHQVLSRARVADHAAASRESGS